MLIELTENLVSPRVRSASLIKQLPGHLLGSAAVEF